MVLQVTSCTVAGILGRVSNYSSGEAWQCSLCLLVLVPAQVDILANRQNTVNGRLYKQEPAKLAFEVRSVCRVPLHKQS